MLLKLWSIKHENKCLSQETDTPLLNLKEREKRMRERRINHNAHILLTATEFEEMWRSEMFLKWFYENAQVRAFNKTWATRSWSLGCHNYFVIFATSQCFHLVCRMGLSAVYWHFGFSVVFFSPFSCSVNPNRKGVSSGQFRTEDIEVRGWSQKLDAPS